VDFKSVGQEGLYDLSQESKKYELAKDVAAFANAGGGLILKIGVIPSVLHANFPDARGFGTVTLCGLVSGTGRRGLATLIAGALAAGGLVAAGVATLEPGAASASSHREAPLISGQPRYDNTDVYAFVSPDNPETTTIIANWIPFEDPAGGPNFYTFADEAQYDIHIDNNGDAQGELLLRYTFKRHTKSKKTFLYNTGPVTSLDDPDLNVTQTYDIELFKLHNQKVVSKTKLADDIPVAPSNVGKGSMPDYGTLRRQAVRELADGAQTFAGQADEPFFLDLRVFDLLYGGDLSEVGNDTLKGCNVNSVALQLPT